MDSKYYYRLSHLRNHTTLKREQVAELQKAGLSHLRNHTTLKH